VTVATTTDSPAALAWSTDNCQVARTMAVLGEKSTLVVLREVFNGVRRFDDMQRHSGVNRQVLSTRLATLVEAGILRRVPYQSEGSRQRHEYRPTQKGFDLYPVLTALAEWGAQYLADPEGPAVEMAHRDCGAKVRPVLTCDAGHAVDDFRDVVPRPGPGATRAV
jgi:DNA-binding HxlR family transcriptional regulator